MKPKNRPNLSGLFAALIVLAITAVFIPTATATAPKPACSFDTHAEFVSLDLEMTTSMSSDSGSAGKAVSLTDVCLEISVTKGVGEDCSRYNDEVSGTGNWEFSVTSLGRDPPLPGTYYTATYAGARTWAQSNSYCVLVSQTCNISVSDGSVLKDEWKHVSPWGSSSTKAVTYKVVPLASPHAHCWGTPGGGGNIVLPSGPNYVSGHIV